MGGPLVQVERPVKMGAGAGAGGADGADALARLDMLPDRHTDAVHVLVGRGEAMAVIDDDGAAGIEEIALGQRHGAAGRGDDRGAARGRDIDTAMRRAGLAIEDALAAIDAGDRAGRRPMQWLLEEGRVGGGRAGPRAHRPLALDALP